MRELRRLPTTTPCIGIYPLRAVDTIHIQGLSTAPSGEGLLRQARLCFLEDIRAVASQGDGLLNVARISTFPSILTGGSGTDFSRRSSTITISNRGTGAFTGIGAKAPNR